MKIEIESTKLEQLLREIRYAYLEGFKAYQFSEGREQDLFNSSIAAKVITNYSKDFNLNVSNLN